MKTALTRVALAFAASAVLLGLGSPGPSNAAEVGPKITRTYLVPRVNQVYAGSQFRDLVTQVSTSVDSPEEKLRRLQPVLEFCTQAPSGATSRRVSVADDAEADELRASLAAGESIELLDHACAGALNAAAFVSVDQGKSEKAMQYLDEAIRLAPFDASTYSERGFLFNAAGKRQEALASYRRGLMLAERYAGSAHVRPIMLRGLGWTLVELGDFEGAEAAYRRSLELEPDHAGARAELAYIQGLRKSDSPAPATPVFDTTAKPLTDRQKVVQFTRAFELDPKHAGAEANRSWLIEWIQQAPDLEVRICDLLGSTKVPAAQKDTASLVLVQYIAGNASYQIEHPGSDPSSSEVQLAGVRSALKSYHSMLERGQATPVASFDALYARQAEGSLEAYLKPQVESRCK